MFVSVYAVTPRGLWKFARSCVSRANEMSNDLASARSKDDAARATNPHHGHYHEQSWMAWRSVEYLGVLVWEGLARSVIADCPDQTWGTGGEDGAFSEFDYHDQPELWPEEDRKWFLRWCCEASRRVVGRSIDPASRSTSPSSNFAEDYELHFWRRLVDGMSAEVRLMVAQVEVDRVNRDRAEYRAKQEAAKAEEARLEAERVAARRARRAERRAVRAAGASA
jgi:hypothetical protein